MRFLQKHSQRVLTLVWLVAFISSTGCATNPDDGTITLPWNSPKPGDTGMPPGMMQGR
jgi:hypothetical protein